ncbi:MAG: cysteine desulfurase family protein [Verrucomicrobiales bacterium]
MAAADLIYLDQNATTPLSPEAWEAMLPFLRENWANPSSGYRFARRARQAVQLAREQVAALLGVTPEEIVFTSGGTESSNAALRSAVALHPERRHVVTCMTEHEATLRPCEALAAQGYEVTLLPVDGEGRLDLAAYEAALRPDQTACVSLMWANNETGLIHPIAEAAALAHERGILFHTDAVQAIGKVPIDFAATRVHYASLSGHKLHAPKGVGAMYVNRGARFHPSQLGGGQESGRRSGTLNVPGIVGLGAAAEAARHQLAADGGALAQRRDRFEAELRRRLPGVHLHGAQAPRLPNTSNFRLEGVDAQGAIILLDNQGVCVSSGSACATGSIKPSHVLTAMGLASRPARETLRVSLSRATSDQEIDSALAALEAAAHKLRVTRA